MIGLDRRRVANSLMFGGMALTVTQSRAIYEGGVASTVAQSRVTRATDHALGMPFS